MWERVGVRGRSGYREDLQPRIARVVQNLTSPIEFWLAEGGHWFAEVFGPVTHLRTGYLNLNPRSESPVRDLWEEMGSFTSGVIRAAQRIANGSAGGL